MKKLSNILAEADNGAILICCPGCKRTHILYYKNNVITWSWNGDVNKPSFMPSIKNTYKHPKGYTNDNPAPLNWVGEYVTEICHSFISEGKFHFCEDSTHELAGKIVDMLPFNYEAYELGEQNNG